ncbi:D-glycero-beta-D-manno-heptose 1-phosphate adenylyltransferase [bacterium]|nr:D-glycero-beta-D-manno-heptose 1-phosphate adenylyltransferase [bacterium]
MNNTQKTIDEIRHRKSNGEVCVFTNGCFDILHAGHVHILEKASEMGDFLVLGLNSDESVTRLKGKGRPVNDLFSRIAVLEAIRYVDYVLVFEDDTPRELILQIQPDILVKGGDYEPDIVVGGDIVESSGGRVKIVPLLEGFSTSDVIQQLSESDEDDTE